MRKKKYKDGDRDLILIIIFESLMCMHTHTLPFALLPSPTPVDHGLRAPDAQPAPRTRGRDATMMQGCDRIASRFHPVTRPWGRDADRNQVAARGCGSQRANNGGRSSGGIEISTCSPAEVRYVIIRGRRARWQGLGCGWTACSGGGGGGCHWAVEGRTPDERRACWLAGRLGGRGFGSSPWWMAGQATSLETAVRVPGALCHPAMWCVCGGGRNAGQRGVHCPPKDSVAPSHASIAYAAPWRAWGDWGGCPARQRFFPDEQQRARHFGPLAIDPAALARGV